MEASFILQALVGSMPVRISKIIQRSWPKIWIQVQNIWKVYILLKQLIFIIFLQKFCISYTEFLCCNKLMSWFHMLIIFVMIIASFFKLLFENNAWLYTFETHCIIYSLSIRLQFKLVVKTERVCLAKEWSMLHEFWGVQGRHKNFYRHTKTTKLFLGCIAKSIWETVDI